MKRLLIILVLAFVLCLVTAVPAMAAPSTPPPERFPAFVHLPQDMPDLPDQSLIHQYLQGSWVSIHVPMDAIGTDNPVIEGD